VFAARASGLASGLALAARPAGLAEVPGVQGRGQPRQCAAFRPADCDIFTTSGALGASASAWPWCRRARQRDTAGTAGGRPPGAAVCGSSPRRRARVRRTRRKPPPRNGEAPGEPGPPTAGHPTTTAEHADSRRLASARRRMRPERMEPSQESAVFRAGGADQP
jgi:hypothetical protein